MDFYLTFIILDTLCFIAAIASAAIFICDIYRKLFRKKYTISFRMIFTSLLFTLIFTFLYVIISFHADEIEYFSEVRGVTLNLEEYLNLNRS